VPVTPTPPPPVEAPPPEPAAPTAEEIKAAETKAAEVRAATRRRTEVAAASVPVRDGTVNLAVTPWGEVLVDGVARGVSPPLTQVSLPPGSHTIEIRNPSAPPFTVRVELRSGEAISLQHRF